MTLHFKQYNLCVEKKSGKEKRGKIYLLFVTNVIVSVILLMQCHT